MLAVALGDAGLDDAFLRADAEVDRVAGFLGDLLQEEPLGPSVALGEGMHLVDLAV